MTLLSGLLLFCVGYLCGALVTRNAELQRRQERIEALRKAVAGNPNLKPSAKDKLAAINENLAAWMN